MINNKKSRVNYLKNNFIKANVMIFQIKKAFTLVEVFIATFISSIVLSFIFIFLSDISSWILDTKNEIIFMWHFYDFTYKLNNYRNIYTTWSILVNNTSTWSDIFIFKDESWTSALLLWPVKLSNNKLYTDNTIYEDRWIWFKKLSATELSDLATNLNNIYDFHFQDDQIYSDLKLQDLSFESYDSWKIYDMNLTLNPYFQINLVWQYWVDLAKDDLKIFNIDF